MADAGSSVGVAKAIADPLSTLGALLNAVTPEGRSRRPGPSPDAEGYRARPGR
jgi:hypothetical protein